MNVHSILLQAVSIHARVEKHKDNSEISTLILYRFSEARQSVEIGRFNFIETPNCIKEVGFTDSIKMETEIVLFLKSIYKHNQELYKCDWFYALNGKKLFLLYDVVENKVGQLVAFGSNASDRYFNFSDRKEYTYGEIIKFYTK